MGNSGPTLLLVDDEEPLRRVLHARLKARGYLIYEAATGAEALGAVPELRPDVILLDIGLPDIDGVEVARRLRGFVQTPIIMLSIRGADSDKIAALNAGADDYLVKPCDITDLLDRIRMALFRRTIASQPVVTLGDLVVDLRRREVRIGKDRVDLTADEYSLLNAFILNAGRLLTQGLLAREAWGERSEADALQLLRKTISTLRQKLDPGVGPARVCRIEAEPGVGYRLHIAIPPALPDSRL